MKSYLRFLSRNKLYTAIEVVGLSVALAFVLLIGTYVYQQYSAVYGVRDHDRVFSVGSTNDKYTTISSFMGTAQEIKEHVPEIELAGSYESVYGGAIEMDQRLMHADCAAVDNGFIEIFQPRLIAGSYDDFKLAGDKIIASRSFANANGGLEAVMDKKLIFEDEEYVVSAVMEDFGQSLFPNVDILFNIDSKINEDKRNTSAFKYQKSTHSFLKIKPDADKDAAVAKINQEHQRIIDEFALFDSDKSLVLSYKELFFRDKVNIRSSLNGSDKNALKLLLGVVVLMLISAIINYINLCSALSGKRTKEMATRIVSGADSKSIFIRYIWESTLLCLISSALATLLATALEPLFNRLLMSDVPVRIDISIPSISVYLLASVLIGIMAGLAPAIIGHSIDPIDVLKGKARRERKRVLGNIFIALQCIISCGLLALATTMQLQTGHLLNKPVGAEIDDLYYLSVNDMRNAARLEKSLKELPFVEAVGVSESFPGQTQKMYTQTKDGISTVGIINCDSTAFSLFNFRKKIDRGYPIYNSVWMPQSTFDAMGLNMENPESNWNIYTPDKAIFGGITEDYAVFDALQDSNGVLTYIIVYGKEGFKPFISSSSGFVIKTTGNHSDNAKAIEGTYKEYIEDRTGLYTKPFKSGYITDLIASDLDEVSNRMKIITIFMLLSILLSFMGLLAMSTYYSSESISDIAIRKVYGSTVGSETLASVWKYMKIVLLSSILSVPVAVYACERYLDEFVYRIENHWWVYMLSVMITMLISLAAVYTQISHASRTNPAEALKKE